MNLLCYASPFLFLSSPLHLRWVVWVYETTTTKRTEQLLVQTLGRITMEKALPHTRSLMIAMVITSQQISHWAKNGRLLVKPSVKAASETIYLQVFLLRVHSEWWSKGGENYVCSRTQWV